MAAASITSWRIMAAAMEQRTERRLPDDSKERTTSLHTQLMPALVKATSHMVTGRDSLGTITLNKRGAPDKRHKLPYYT
ncbi:Hypothetical predicted protein [Pelobates cultripes]|nr:Hypothetical predicted protein [Pelobates cultripes]